MDTTSIKKATILFAGDSGDGIQFTGNQFTNAVAFDGNDLRTFPDFPAEIRAPQGTVAGVSGFQIQFASESVHSPGDQCDVLVAFNAASFKKHISKLKTGGTLIANSSGFDARNLKLAQYKDGKNPLESEELQGYEIHQIDITKLTREALKDSSLSAKQKGRAKNMFVLGFILWIYNKSVANSIKFLKEKFNAKPEIRDANIAVFRAGYHYGETIEALDKRFEIEPAKLEKGTYRNITGNRALAIGLIAAAKKANLNLFYSGYPITPASDILHFLNEYRNYGIKIFQAEDEIAAIGATIGASFGGDIGVTASSGPGIALKGEAIGLSFMLELPLLIINVQRGGPSTGLPTKTEQADLFQAMYGRNGESPIPVLAVCSPTDAFKTAFEAVKIAIEHMTPVMLLSDAYIANGSALWKIPQESELNAISASRPNEEHRKNEKYFPYLRDERQVRTWAIPGMKGFESRLGGLEKEDKTGAISYAAENHQKMVKIRQKKVAQISEYIPLQTIDKGNGKGKTLVVSWGGTYGVISEAVSRLIQKGKSVSHVHIKYLNPLPKNLKEIVQNFDEIYVAELNTGQLLQILRSKYLIDAKGINKIMGQPFTVSEIIDALQ